MDITRTMPQTESPEMVNGLFGGLPRRCEFPFGQRVKNVVENDFLYLIYQGRVHGRFRIAQVDQLEAEEIMEVGTEGNPVNSITIVWVHLPGELVTENTNIPRPGHRNHRYDDVPEWPDN